MNEKIPFDLYSKYFKGENFSTAGMHDIPVINRVLFIGTCALEIIKLNFTQPSDYVLFWQGNLPSPPKPIEEYDFQVIQVPLRSIVNDSDLMSLSYKSKNSWEHALVIAKSRLEEHFTIYAKYLKSHGKTTFILNYISPSVNTIGRLHSPYDIRNYGHFIRNINLYLQELTDNINGAYVIDVDNLANMYGKRYFSEEFLLWYTHGGLGWSFAEDGTNGSRVEITPHTVDYYEILSPHTFAKAINNEIIGAWTTLKAHSSIKLIVVDLDDTLWRGVVGELSKEDIADPGLMKAVWGDLAEGWPLGLAEALQICRMRGILLGIISKNNQEVIDSVFNKIFGGKLKISDFSIVRINWLEKSANMQSILKVANILPDNVLYVDDSPIERDLMLQQYPNMLIIGKYFQYTRHILISSPYTQVANINEEAFARAETIKFRDANISSDVVLDKKNQILQKSILHRKITTDSPKLVLNRVFELTRKTNQWKLNNKIILDENVMGRFFSNNICIDCFEAKVNDLDFGIVCVICRSENKVLQFVMSCRVAGLDIEKEIFDIVKGVQFDKLIFDFEETSKNLPMKEWIAINCQLSDNLYIYKTKNGNRPIKA